MRGGWAVRSGDPLRRCGGPHPGGGAARGSGPRRAASAFRYHACAASSPWRWSPVPRSLRRPWSPVPARRRALPVRNGTGWWRCGHRGWLWQTRRSSFPAAASARPVAPHPRQCCRPAPLPATLPSAAGAVAADGRWSAPPGCRRRSDNSSRSLASGRLPAAYACPETHRSRSSGAVAALRAALTQRRRHPVRQRRWRCANHVRANRAVRRWSGRNWDHVLSCHG
jgi:hypothetical protein